MSINSSMSNLLWNFYRGRSNHAYLYGEGEITYKGVCENSLIISSRKTNSLYEVKNSFIFSNGQNTEIVSISDFERIKKFTGENRFGEIKYNIPLNVRKREELLSYNPEEIKKILKGFYGINSELVHPILSGRIKAGKYFIRDTNGKEYIFKYKGDNDKEMELISEIFSELKSHFPQSHKRIDNLNYGINLQDGFYGLEDFIVGDQIKKRDLDYIKKIGEKIALLHNDLDSFFGGNSKVDFITQGENFNESNILSLYIDLINNPDSEYLIHFVEEIIDHNFSDKLRKISKRMIHGDINSSNVINKGENLFIVDSETFGKDNRLKEFISPLLLEGNMIPPNYLAGGLQIMIDQYNKYAKDPLSIGEISILPYLLQSAALKYYVIKEIRRKNKTKNGLQKTIENLEKIRRDSDAH